MGKKSLAKAKLQKYLESQVSSEPEIDEKWQNAAWCLSVLSIKYI